MDIAHDNHSFIDRTETNPLTRKNFIHGCFRCISRLTTHHRLLFLGLVVRPEKIFTARYFIPISGMILGNMLSANVIALNSFYGSLNRERQLYLYLLGNGASPSEALTPFMREALIKSFNPTIASMAVMGLIALPGTMTGQILGGSSPSVAIKYQIMLMITIFASSLISVLLTLWISRKKTFDKYGMTKF